MKKANRSTVRWAVAAICAASWAYALVARYTDFFMAPRIDKVILLGSSLVAAGLLSTILFHRLLPGIFKVIHEKTFLRTTALCTLAAAALLLLIFPPFYFPEHHSLEIIPIYPSDEVDITIIKILRIEMPSGEKLGISPTMMSLQGNWQVDSFTGTITSTGDPQSKINYNRLMQAGVEVVFKTGPQQGKARVTWDGKENILNLNASDEGNHSITLMPALDWRRADITRKVLVGFTLTAEFMGLSALFFIIAYLPKVFTVRNFGTITFFAAILLLLLPIVSAVDPPAQFKDPNLEAAVREVLNQPDGEIHQHKLLTIAKLDAIEYGITNLDGIQYIRNLASLNLRDNSITEIKQISELTKLRELNLRGNTISDITPLAKLVDLESLDLRDNPITAISPIIGLTRIRELNLHGIPLGAELSFLQNFPDLNQVNLRGCGITDISVLSGLMAEGILQDDPLLGNRARVDIRDNPIPRYPADGYASIRPYWQYISERAPFTLPVFNTLDAPAFSHPGGFYEDDFLLELSVKDPQTAIHFTLDGSEPTRDSPLYDHPLWISTRAGQPNVLSEIRTISPTWEGPIGEVFKATVVRAKAFLPEDMHSTTITHTYFVDQEIKSRYSLPIISISTDPDYFFDYDEGIYVMGREYDDRADPGDSAAGNYNQRGGRWERPVHIEFFDASGNLSLAQGGGVRIHGSSIRKYTQKSLRLYADDAYDRADYFENIFFPGLSDSSLSDPITDFKVLLLRNSGNNMNYPYFRDTILQELFSHTTLDLYASQPVLVFLNGEYWGIYNLRENLDEQFLVDHYQIEPQQVVILERNNQINFGKPGDEIHYQALKLFIRDNDINASEHYQYVTTQIDIENFIDYQIAEIYSANRSWPQDNIKYWRYKTDAYQPDAPYGQDGRWRWLLFDLDNGFGYGEGTSFKNDTLKRATGDFMIRSLLVNTDFRSQFINRFADHLNTILAPEYVIPVINEIKAAIDPEMQEHINRWRVMDGSMDVWEENVDIMRIFARKRPEVIRQHIIDTFDLKGTAHITLRADSNAGYIRINSIDIKSDTPGVKDAGTWSGIYFQDVPVSISAIPKTGYTFAGWEGVDQSNPDVLLTLTGDLVLTANFTPIE